MTETIDDGDMCMICREVITIPVIPLLDCKCSISVCLFCFRDYLGLNNLQNDELRERRKCMICRTFLRSDTNRPYQKASRRELVMLDNKYGKIDCPRKCGWNGSRVQLDEKHIAECKKVYRSCKLCGKYDVVENHTAKCVYCDVEVEQCQYEIHCNFNCDKAVKCLSCRNAMSLHLSQECVHCKERIYICEKAGVSMRTHLRECRSRPCPECKEPAIEHGPSNPCINCTIPIPNCKTMEQHYLRCPATFYTGVPHSVHRPEEFCTQCHICKLWVLADPEAIRLHKLMCMTFFTFNC